MLYLVSAPEALSVAFDSPLNAAGKSQALYLQQWMARSSVFVLYAAPSQRCLETIGGFILQRRQAGQYIRPEIRFELCDRVTLPEMQPHGLEVDAVRAFGIPPQNILGTIPSLETTTTDFERRVVEWFTNDFMEKYRDAPNPTALVADKTVLEPIIKFLTRRMPQFSKTILNSAEIMEFKSDGLNLAFSQLL